MHYMTAALAENRAQSADRYCLAEEMGGGMQYVQDINGSHVCMHSPAHLVIASEGKQLPVPGDVIP